MPDLSVCEHGGLRRKCEICGLRAQLATSPEALDAKAAQSEDWLRCDSDARDRFPMVADTIAALRAELTAARAEIGRLNDAHATWVRAHQIEVDNAHRSRMTAEAELATARRDAERYRIMMTMKPPTTN